MVKIPFIKKEMYNYKGSRDAPFSRGSPPEGHMTPTKYPHWSVPLSNATSKSQASENKLLLGLVVL